MPDVDATLVDDAANVVGRGAKQIAKYGFNWAKNKIQRIMGSGEYKISDSVGYNVLTNKSQVPAFSKSGSTVSVSHREYVGIVASSSSVGAYNLQTYPFSPTNCVLFPWLNLIASRYKRYRFHGAAVEYKAMSGLAVSGTNATLGVYVMGWTSDPNIKLNNLQRNQLEQQENVISAPPYQNAMCAIECDLSTLTRTWFETNPSITKSGLNAAAPLPIQDAYSTTFGQLYVATDAVPAASVQLGELWITYTIEFEEPTAIVDTTPAWVATPTASGLSGVTATAPVGTAYDVTDTSGGTTINGSTITFGQCFQPGDIVRVEYLVAGVSTANVNAYSFGGPNNIVNIGDGTSVNYTPLAGNTSGNGNETSLLLVPSAPTTSMCLIKIATWLVLRNNIAAPAQINLSSGSEVYPGTISSAYLRVTRLNRQSFTLGT